MYCFRGTSHVLKLSPNLRVMCKPPKKSQQLDQRTLQVRMNDLFINTYNNPIDLIIYNK